MGSTCMHAFGIDCSLCYVLAFARLDGNFWHATSSNDLYLAHLSPFGSVYNMHLYVSVSCACAYVLLSHSIVVDLRSSGNVWLFC